MPRLGLLIAFVFGIFALTPSLAPANVPQAVTISVNRSSAGDLWSATGAFTDSGTLADAPQSFTRTGTYHVFRTYSGSNGTFVARADVKIVATATPGVFAVTGYWTIISGTDAFANLHGTGTLSETFDANEGTVVGTWEGSVHFD
jgi:hypothetical protein